MDHDHDAELTAVFGQHLLRQDARPTGAAFHREFKLLGRLGLLAVQDGLQEVHPRRILLEGLPGFLKGVFRPAGDIDRPLLGRLIGKEKVSLLIDHQDPVLNGVEKRFDLGLLVNDLFHLHVVVDLELLRHLIERLPEGAEFFQPKVFRHFDVKFPFRHVHNAAREFRNGKRDVPQPEESEDADSDHAQGHAKISLPFEPGNFRVRFRLRLGGKHEPARALNPLSSPDR